MGAPLPSIFHACALIHVPQSCSGTERAQAMAGNKNEYKVGETGGGGFWGSESLLTWPNLN